MYEESSISVEEIIKDVFAHSEGLPEALADTVTLIGNRYEVDVCSIYLRDKQDSKIVLAATVGLNHRCVGQLKMGLHEGLAGLVAEKCCPIALEEAAKHPRYKYFPEAEEDAFESFLGVPIARQGVLIVQTIEPRCYSRDEINCFKLLANELANCLEATAQKLRTREQTVWRDPHASHMPLSKMPLFNLNG